MGFFGGGGASVDLASPPAIGNTTPNTGAFTTLNTSNIFGSGSPDGGVAIRNTSTATNFVEFITGVGFFKNSNNIIASINRSSTKSFVTTSDGFFGWGSSTTNADAATPNASLFSDAANILAQRKGTAAQTFRLYNTFTDASNYERGFFRWNTNVLEIGAEAAGTGTKRNLRVVGPSLASAEAVPALEVTQTWNTTGTPSAILLNVTNTASNTASRLIDLKIGGTTKFAVEALTGAAFTITQYGFTLAGRTDFQDAVGLTSGGEYRIGGDVVLARDAANVFAQRRTTNAQTFRLYRTFTDASNYERLGFIATRTTRFAIAAENAGTGAARSLEISFYTSASDPASTDITDGCFSVWKNSGTGTIKLWANDGGTMKSVALA